MEIKNFKISKIYTRNQLAEVFGGHVFYGGGMIISNKTNSLLLISKHTNDRIYNDTFENDLIIYTGEGQRGDQQLTKGNKKLYNAERDNIDIHLFCSFKEGQYIYYGLVKLASDIYHVDEKDVDGNMRKVIKFPLKRLTNGFTPLTDDEMRNIDGGGFVSIKKTYNVVGAAIIKDGAVLCAQRNKGTLIGKWEFPGGKIEESESPVEALRREIKEELNIEIEICDKIDTVSYEYDEFIVNLSVFTCKHISGEIKCIEHKQLKWTKIDELKTLDWANADMPIVDALIDLLPSKIIEQINYNYYEINESKRTDRDIIRATQDYDLAQKRKKQSGEKAEQAVLRYEKDKLNNAGRPDLADMVEQVSKKSSDYGYDILSFDIKNDIATEIHIEVKSATLTNSYIEFFISENELDKFKNDVNHRIYCLIRSGKNYKLHIVKKDDFFEHNHLNPLIYKVKIKINT